MLEGQSTATLTLDTRIVRLHMDFRHLAVFDHKCIPLTPGLTEDSSAVELEIKCFRKSRMRIG